MSMVATWLGRAGTAGGSVAAGALAAHLTLGATEPARARPTPPPERAVEAPTLEALVDPRPTPAPVATAAPIEAPVYDAVRSDLNHGAIVTGQSSQRLILFTFDDGPDPRYTRRLLDQLDARHVRALFFLTAERFAGNTPWARENREIVREIVARGHPVASHGYRHFQFTRLSTPELNAELDRADASFIEAIGLRPTLIRPPGGARSPRTDAVLAARGYTTVMWNLGTGDAQVRTADEVVDTFRRVMIAREHETGARGGIVLLHDIHAWSLEAFPRIIDHLERRNCALYEAGEELYDVVDDPAVFFAARLPENTPSDEAPWAELPEDVHAARQAALRERTGERCERLALR
jgi:peptidoglycan/xylan/chitin deacetylase (PgdA/CDA1 family)